MKKLLLLIMFLNSVGCFAQDVIVKKDGSTIISKVTDVSSSEVKYKKYSNKDGPTYTISKSMIKVINFENGEKEDFGKERDDSGVSIKRKLHKDWNTLYIQYNPSNFNFSVDNAKWDESSSFKGITIGYNHAFNIVPQIPLYFNPGIELQYSFDTKITPLTDDKLVSKMEYKKLGNPYFFSIIAPLNITYKHTFPNGMIAIAPFAGINIRGNVLGFVKVEYTEKSKSSAYNPNGSFSYDDDNWYIFSESDMGKDYAWKTIQFGWQVGVNLIIKEHFMVGASYESDFTKIFDYKTEKVSARINRFSVSLGYVF